MLALEVRPRALKKYARRLLLPLPVGELFAERGLFEFAYRCTGQGFEEYEGVGKLPFGKRLSQKGAKFFWRDLCAVLQDDRRERPFLPFRMRYADYRGFFDGGMPHQRVLNVDRADPLATGLHQVFGAVDNFYEAFVIDGGNVARFEPAICGPSMSLVRRIVVAGSYPGTTDFQFAGSVAVARSFDRLAFEAFRPHDAEFNEGSGPALFGANFVLLVGGPLTHVPFEFADSCEWRGFGHAPEMQDVEIVFVESAHESLGRRGPSDDDPNGPVELPAAGIFLKRCEDAQPDGRNTARNGTCSWLMRSRTLSGSTLGPGRISRAPAIVHEYGKPQAFA
jgi:hypothetical protein